MKKRHIFDFFRYISSVFGAFSHFFGCKILVFGNPACVKGMTNMRYAGTPRWFLLVVSNTKTTKNQANLWENLVHSTKFWF